MVYNTVVNKNEKEYNMNIKTELIKSYIADIICNSIYDFDIDADKIADSTATKALGEIQQILHTNELDDFKMVEEVVMILGEVCGIVYF